MTDHQYTSRRYLPSRRSRIQRRHAILAAFAKNLLQRGVYVLRHRVGVAAHVDRGTLLHPRIEIAPRIPQRVLHVALLRLVARERHVEPRQHAALQQVLPFELVQEVVRVVAMAEHQPVPTARPDGIALLHEGAERRDPGARPDHDDRPLGIMRQAEMRGRLEKHAHPVAGLAPLGHIHRCDARALPTMRRIADRGDQQMRLVRHRLAAGGDRIVTRRQRSQQRQKLLLGQLARRGLEHVDDLPPIRTRLRTGQRGDVELFQQPPTQLCIPGQPRCGQHGIH